MTIDGDQGRLQPVYEPLAESVRRLIDVSTRTEADITTVADPKSKIDCAAEQLSSGLMPGSFGVRQAGDGQAMAWGNVMIGAAVARAGACRPRGTKPMSSWPDRGRLRGAYTAARKWLLVRVVGGGDPIGASMLFSHLAALHMATKRTHG
jgi:hypothetical protein